MLDAALNSSLTSGPQDVVQAYDSAPQPCGRIWRVAYTHPQAERYASTELQRRGYQTFLPMVWTTRCDRVVWSLRHRIQVPAFKRYVFVQADGQWTPIRYTAGVADLVWSEPGKPGAVPDSLIAALRSALQADAALSAPSPLWKPGTPCSLASGAFYGLPAVVTSITDQTATIAIMMLGQLRSLSVPTDCLTTRGE